MTSLQGNLSWKKYSIEIQSRNLLVDGSKEDIRIKVADFGLAQHFSSYLQFTELEENSLLPIRWTAVEVLRTHKATQKSDVWSFGM